MIESTGTPEITAELLCPYCGYDLRGRDGDTCSECGGAVDDASLQAAMVPWERRKEIGRTRAIAKTVGRVVFRPRAFSRSVGMAVSYRDARLFQAWIVGLWIMAAAVCMWLTSPLLMTWLIEEFIWESQRNGWPSFVWRVPAAVSLLVFMPLATGLHTYFVAPRDLSQTYKNRAIALAYYACGPLLLSAIGCALVSADIAWSRFAYGWYVDALDELLPILMPTLRWVGISSVVLGVAGWLYAVGAMLQMLSLRHAVVTACVAVGYTVLMLALAAAATAIPIAVLLFVYVISMSMR